VLMSGETGKCRGMILMPRWMPAVRMGVGRNVQKFGGDQATTGGEMRLPWFDRGRFVANW
jgi:hypothetical protein